MSKLEVLKIRRKTDCKLCGGRSIRTTKNYKPARKCHKCGNVEINTKKN